MKRLLLTYDTPEWAFHGECLDLQWFLFRRYGKQLETVVMPARDVSNGSGFDGVYSSAWYDTRLMDHPRSASQLSSYSYWQDCKKAKDRKDQLRRWKWLATKNAGLHQRLLLEGFSPRLLYHQLNPNKWPWNETQPEVRGKFRVGFAGHRQPTKGIGLIEQAMASIPGAELVTVEWKQGRIPQSDMPKWYHSLHCYVCASLQEGGPRTGLEVMLCGVPLVTTRVGQVGEMVHDSIEAVIVERTVESIAAGIKRMMVDKHMRERIAWNAHHVAYFWAMKYGMLWARFLGEVAGLEVGE